MSQLAKLQADFQTYLLDESQGSNFIESIVDDKKVGAKKRLNIYHDAYRLRIIEALANSYPQLKALMGEVLFNKVSREYIVTHPSTHRNLRWYGSEMRDHLLETLPQHPVVAEMADFEWNLSLAFDSEDVPELSLQDLAAIPPENWVDLCFHLQPSIKIIRTYWNVIPIWQALEDEEAPPKPNQESIYQSWLIWRKKFNVQFRSMSKREVIALNMAMMGATFGEICAISEGELSFEETTLISAQYLSSWLENGLICKAVMIEFEK
jgi:hypothetical protein